MLGAHKRILLKETAIRDSILKQNSPVIADHLARKFPFHKYQARLIISTANGQLLTTHRVKRMHSMPSSERISKQWRQTAWNG